MRRRGGARGRSAAGGRRDEGAIEPRTHPSGRRPAGRFGYCVRRISYRPEPERFLAHSSEAGDRTPSPARPGPPDSLCSGKCRPGVGSRGVRPTSRARRREHLLKEFAERTGDPETGGSTSRQRVTAYRQDALRCARELAVEGVLKVSLLRERTGVSRAGSILRDNHYGWFDRVKPGHYALSPRGGRELPNWYEALERLPSRSAASVEDALTPQSLPLRRRMLHDGHRRPVDGATTS
jgi:hypothetical protein